MKTDRLVSILMILLDKKKATARELADTFEVSVRTIYRDIDALSLAGIPVLSSPGVNGGFEIMPGYKVDQNVFSACDLSALLMGLSGLNKVLKTEEMLSALTKIKRLIPPEQEKEITYRSNQIRIDPTPWFGNREIEANLIRIRSALDKHSLISFFYKGIHGRGMIRIAEPYQLVYKDQSWYLWAYCRIKEDYRLFKLSRMSGLFLTGEFFLPRDFEQPELDIDEITAPMQSEILLRIHSSIMDRVLDYCPFDKFTPDGEDYYLVSFPFIENDYYYDALLSFGSKCECLSPKHVREGLKKRILELADLYS